MRVLMVARRRDRRAHHGAEPTRHLVTTADEPIRKRFEGLTPIQLTAAACALRPRKTDPVRYATLLTIRSLAQRVHALKAET
jgi:hypothetical protein